MAKINLSDYIAEAYNRLPILKKFDQPWQITANPTLIIEELLKDIGSDYLINGVVAVHKKATVENNVIFKGPVIIGEGCFVGANTYFRGGIFLDNFVTVGPFCEVKSSFIFSHSAIAHLNYVGHSLVGQNVNIEAGAVLAVHYNERVDKEITVNIDGQNYSTGIEKFGSILGDNTKIGANAVLSPGTILKPKSIIERLQLVKQN